MTTPSRNLHSTSKPYEAGSRSQRPSPAVLKRQGHDGPEVDKDVGVSPETRLELLVQAARKHPKHPLLLLNDVVSIYQSSKVPLWLAMKVGEAFQHAQWCMNPAPDNPDPDNPAHDNPERGLDMTQLLAYTKDHISSLPLIRAVSFIGYHRMTKYFSDMLKDKARCEEVKEFHLQDYPLQDATETLRHFPNLETMVIGWGCHPRDFGGNSRYISNSLEQLHKTTHLIVNTHPYTTSGRMSWFPLPEVKKLRETLVEIVLNCNHLQCDLGFYTDSKILKTVCVSLLELQCHFPTPNLVQSDNVRRLVSQKDTVVHLCYSTIEIDWEEVGLLELFEKHGHSDFHPKSIGGPNACRALEHLKLRCYENTMALWEFAEPLSKLLRWTSAKDTEGKAIATVEFISHPTKRFHTREEQEREERELEQAMKQYFGTRARPRMVYTSEWYCG